MAQTPEGAIKVRAKQIGISVEEYSSLVQSGYKWCTACKTWHTKGEFGLDKSRSDGLAAYCSASRKVKERKSTKGRVSTFKGRSHSPETKLKMSEQRKGRPSPKKGIARTDEVRIKIKASLRSSPLVNRGESHYAYSHGRHQRAKDARRTVEYAEWRTAVFTRDKFTCQHCGDNRGGNLHAHHIKSFAEHPEFRFDVTNGITLCQECHERVHLKPIPQRPNRRKKHPVPS